MRPALLAVHAHALVLPAMIPRDASRREARGWVVASRECAPRRADGAPSGAASSTARPRSSTAPSGRAVNRTAEERCAPCGNDHSVWRALRHGDAGQISHCKRDLKRPLYGARRAGSAMEGVFRVASPCELLMHFGRQRIVATAVDDDEGLESTVLSSDRPGRRHNLAQN